MTESSTKRSRTEYSWREGEEARLNAQVAENSSELRWHLMQLNMRKHTSNEYAKTGWYHPQPGFFGPLPPPQTDFTHENNTTAVLQQVLMQAEQERTIFHRLNMK